MAECNSIECNSVENDFHETHNFYQNLNEQQQFRLNKINEIKDHFFNLSNKLRLKKEN